MLSPNIEAAILIIGNEVLGGEVEERNALFIIENLKQIGIAVAEVRWVRDELESIVAGVNTLRVQYDFLLTTGGIGPTHDDITAQAVAKAFGRSLIHHPQAVKMLQKGLKKRNSELTSVTLRMALFPEGSGLIASPEISAPGFYLENVFVMAGVPAVMQQMMRAILPMLPRGKMLRSFAVLLKAPESAVADQLEALERECPEVGVGSYPFENEAGQWEIRLVVRSYDEAALTVARGKTTSCLNGSGFDWQFI